MAKTKLTYQQLQKLAFVLREIFSYIHEWENKGFRNQIKYPQVPSTLSENLAIYELEKGLIPELEGYIFGHGENRVDIVGIKPMQNERVNIEIKATGDQNFIEIRPKDLEADYIIWLCFEGYFKLQTSNLIDIYVIPKPKENGIVAGRVIREKAFKKTLNIRTLHTTLLPLDAGISSKTACVSKRPGQILE